MCAAILKLAAALTVGPGRGLHRRHVRLFFFRFVLFRFFCVFVSFCFHFFCLSFVS